MVAMSLTAVLVGGCGSEDTPTDAATPDGGPPMICHEPGTSPAEWYTEVTEEVGLGSSAAVEPVATSVVAADLDLDGWIDFFAAVFPSQREPDPLMRTRFLFMNRADPQDSDPARRIFVDTIDESGLLATRDGEGGRGITTVTFGDLDNDGDPDAVGCSAEISTALVDGCAAFANDGAGHFTLVDGGELELDVFSVPTSVLLDYDRDGVLDFWPGTVGQWQYGPADTSAPRLFRGNGDGSFEEISIKVGLPEDPATPDNYRANFGLTSCDLDGDGDRDVLVGNYGVPIGPNAVWRNDDATFVDVAAELGVERADLGGFTFSITCGDLDEDGDRDLMTAEVAHPGQGTDTSAVLLGDVSADGSLEPFERTDPADLGIDRAPGEMEGDNIAFFEDIDLDGRKDVLILSSNYPQQFNGDSVWTHASLFRQTDDFTFDDMTPKTPFGVPEHQTLEGGVLADIDNDGDLDLVVGTGLFNSAWISENLGISSSAIHVYRNNVGQDANWTRIRLVGAGPGASNKSGIGGSVTVTAGGRSQHREVLGSWGHSNTQTDVWLTFGLGDACTIDTIDVRWPNAESTVSHYEDVLANYPIELTEGVEGVTYGATTAGP